jgi:hypothetical protein
MATRTNSAEEQKNSAEGQKIVDAALRIGRLMPNEENEASKRITILVNVVSSVEGFVISRANELRAEGRSEKEIRKEIVESAAQFGKRMAFYAEDERLSDLPRKTIKAAVLFVEDMQLALDACEAFVQVRIKHREWRGLGDEQDFGYAYRKAVQEIVRAVEPSRVPVAPRK